VSFASEPGRDDDNPSPLNIVIPDDARELDRDVLAYRREMRAKRRRQRLLRLFRPFRTPEFGGHAAIIPLIAVCLAVSLVGGALLSVMTMSQASAPTLSSPPTATRSASPTEAAAPAAKLIPLPPGSVQLDGSTVPVRSLVSSAIALVPVSCDCSTDLRRLAGQAAAVHVKLYFAGPGKAIAQLDTLAARYGAVAASDYHSVLTAAYRPDGLTVLLVYKNAAAEVVRNLPANFQLTPTLRELGQPSTSLSTSQPTPS
jgi:hypothetical protein